MHPMAIGALAGAGKNESQMEHSGSAPASATLTHKNNPRELQRVFSSMSSFCHLKTYFMS